MYHSVTFGDKNTWDDWHLVPSSRPVFSMPALKSKYIDLPGSNGVLDLTDTFNGYPTYSNREGSLEFIVMNGYAPWYKTYSDIANYLHGKKMKAILEDDKNYFYEGRFTVKEWNSKKPPRSLITIDYNLSPYKWSTALSTDEWKWDPFNFFNGVIRQNAFKNISVDNPNGYKDITFTNILYGNAPVRPDFILTDLSYDQSGMTMDFFNKILDISGSVRLSNGHNEFSDIVFYGESVKIRLKGQGKLDICFRAGEL